MAKIFQCIAIVGLPRDHSAMETHQQLYYWLQQQGYRTLIDDQLAGYLTLSGSEFASLTQIGEQADLVIVIGGDGNMLRAARALAGYAVKLIGINRGHLGFLTDIDPEEALHQLTLVLAGQYREDPRFVLEVAVMRNQQRLHSTIAINEAVIHPSKVAHMIDYQAYINQRPAFAQRADGLIIATPTGSTAYSLSAGGPIIAPGLDAFIITPMFPHSLSARPLVVRSDDVIRLTFPQATQDLEVTCDSQLSLLICPQDEVIIQRAPVSFCLLHSKEYDYFQNLSSKLGWSKKMY